MADLLSIGKTGLFASKKSLETTGHNMANANTEGYSRQRVNQSTNVPVLKGGLIQGTGARVTSVTRVHDPLLEKKLNNSLSDNSFFNERVSQMEQVEALFNEVDNEGLHKILTRFYNSFRELSNQPENETVRSVVRDNAAMAIQDFKRLRSTLNELSANIDRKLNADIITINQSMKEVAKLNKQIADLEAANHETGDLRDKRDIQIRELAKFFNVISYQDNKGKYVVAAKNVGTLVSGGEYQELASGPSPRDKSSNDTAGSVEIYFTGRSAYPITNRIKGGVLASALKARNIDISTAQKNIDTIAYEFINTVNAVHRRGFVNRTIEIDANGSPASNDAHGPTTGINFFKEPVQRENASFDIQLSDEVKDDLSNIAVALVPNAPGDNRVAIAISKLQHEKVLNNGAATLEENYLQIIGNIGLETGKARLDKEQSEGILVQTQSLKERISGVSIDEEAANMIRYQQAYDASARVMRTADEMFKTVLSIAQ